MIRFRAIGFRRDDLKVRVNVKARYRPTLQRNIVIYMHVETRGANHFCGAVDQVDSRMIGPDRNLFALGGEIPCRFCSAFFWMSLLPCSSYCLYPISVG